MKNIILKWKSPGTWSDTHYLLNKEWINNFLYTTFTTTGCTWLKITTTTTTEICFSFFANQNNPNTKMLIEKIQDFRHRSKQRCGRNSKFGVYRKIPYWILRPPSYFLSYDVQLQNVTSRGGNRAFFSSEINPLQT